MNNDQLAEALAERVGFKSSRTHRTYMGIMPVNPTYKWELQRQIPDDRLKNNPISPPLLESFNPCSEIPLDYILKISIDKTFFIINEAIKLDINDPSFLETLDELFKNLHKLTETIQNSPKRILTIKPNQHTIIRLTPFFSHHTSKPSSCLPQRRPSTSAHEST